MSAEQSSADKDDLALLVGAWFDDALLGEALQDERRMISGDWDIEASRPI